MDELETLKSSIKEFILDLNHYLPSEEFVCNAFSEAIKILGIEDSFDLTKFYLKVISDETGNPKKGATIIISIDDQIYTDRDFDKITIIDGILRFWKYNSFDGMTALPVNISDKEVDIRKGK